MAEGRIPLVFALQPPPESPPFIRLPTEPDSPEEYLFDSTDEVIHIMRSADHSRDKRNKRSARRAGHQEDGSQSGYMTKSDGPTAAKHSSDMQALRSDLHSLRAEMQGLKQGAIVVATEQQRQAEVQAVIQSQVVATHRHQQEIAAYQQQHMNTMIHNNMLSALAQFHGTEAPQLPSIPDIPQPPPLKPMLAVESGRSKREVNTKTRPLPAGGTPAERRYPKKQDIDDDDDDARSMTGVTYDDARSDGATGAGG